MAVLLAQSLENYLVAPSVLLETSIISGAKDLEEEDELVSFLLWFFECIQIEIQTRIASEFQSRLASFADIMKEVRPLCPSLTRLLELLKEKDENFGLEIDAIVLDAFSYLGKEFDKFLKLISLLDVRDDIGGGRMSEKLGSCFALVVEQYGHVIQPLLFLFLERQFVLFTITASINYPEIESLMPDFRSVLSILNKLGICLPLTQLTSLVIDSFLSLILREESNLHSLQHDVILDNSHLEVFERNSNEIAFDSDSRHSVFAWIDLLDQLSSQSYFKYLVKIMKCTLIPYLNFFYRKESVIEIQLPIFALCLDKFNLSYSSRLFEIIRDNETVLLKDLHLCLMHAYPASMQRAASLLSTAVNTRLLQPGATTQDIITQYLSLLSSLRILDPSGVMLQIISTPIIKYLNKRVDTVRCVSFLFYATLLYKHALQMHVEVGTFVGISQDALQFFDSLPAFSHSLLLGTASAAEQLGSTSMHSITFHWQPEPCHKPTMLPKTPFTQTVDYLAELCFLLKGYQDIDLNSSFKTLLGDYKNMLAHRLLFSPFFDSDTEWALLELIKLRFGDNLVGLVPCEVMLKDMNETRRTQSNIYQACKKIDTRLPSFGWKESPIVRKALRFSLGPETPIHVQAAGNRSPMLSSPPNFITLPNSSARSKRVLEPRFLVDAEKDVSLCGVFRIEPSSGEEMLQEGVLGSAIISAEFWPVFSCMELEVKEDEEDELDDEQVINFEDGDAKRISLDWKQRHLPAIKGIFEVKGAAPAGGFQSRCGVLPHEIAQFHHVPNLIRYAMVEFSRLV